MSSISRAHLGPLEELTDDQIKRNFDVNFFGALRVTRAVLPIMRTQRAGHIINMSAAAAIDNYPGFSVSVICYDVV